MDNFSSAIRVSNAVIEEISFERNTSLVTISYFSCPGCNPRTQRVTLIVSRSTDIRDENGRPMPARDLQVGMRISTAFSAVMTRSIPPQSQAFRIIVLERPRRFAETTGRIINVNARESFITTISGNNPNSIIRFNISPDTVILNPAGRRIPLSLLVPGLRVRIEHATFMTASIPPQTTAFLIQILR